MSELNGFELKGDSEFKLKLNTPSITQNDYMKIVIKILMMGDENTYFQKEIINDENFILKILYSEDNMNIKYGDGSSKIQEMYLGFGLYPNTTIIQNYAFGEKLDLESRNAVQPKTIPNFKPFEEFTINIFLKYDISNSIIDDDGNYATKYEYKIRKYTIDVDQTGIDTSFSKDLLSNTSGFPWFMNSTESTNSYLKFNTGKIDQLKVKSIKVFKYVEE